MYDPFKNPRFRGACRRLEPNGNYPAKGVVVVVVVVKPNLTI
jgi:hypothetical protein